MNIALAHARATIAPTPTSSRLDTLTALRFFAALFVAIHHTRQMWAHTELTDIIGQVGWLGVAFFFTLSGFVLMWNYDPKFSYRKFLTRRLIRIYPLHFITLVLSLIAYFSLGNPFAGYVGKRVGTFASLFLVHDWLPGHPSMRQGWNGVSWTLSCEFFFYLCAPFIFAHLVKRWQSAWWPLALTWLALLILSVASTAFRWGDVLDFLSYHPIPYLLEFVLGALAAIYVRNQRAAISVWLAVFIMVAPLTLYCYFFPESGGYRSGPIMVQLFTPGAVLFIGAVATADRDGARSFLRNPVLVFLGEASFALYMTHALFLGIFSYLVTPLFPQALQLTTQGETVRIAYLTYAILVSAACYEWVETPIRKWLLARASGDRL